MKKDGGFYRRNKFFNKNKQKNPESALCALYDGHKNSVAKGWCGLFFCLFLASAYPNKTVKGIQGEGKRKCCSAPLKT